MIDSRKKQNLAKRIGWASKIVFLKFIGDRICLRRVFRLSMCSCPLSFSNVFVFREFQCPRISWAGRPENYAKVIAWAIKAKSEKRANKKSRSKNVLPLFTVTFFDLDFVGPLFRFGFNSPGYYFCIVFRSVGPRNPGASDFTKNNKLENDKGQEQIESRKTRPKNSGRQ